MTDLEFTFTKICRRRNVTMTKVESVAFAMRLGFGLADLTALLPAVANTFYYVQNLNSSLSVALAGGAPLLRATNLLGGLAGNLDIQCHNVADAIGNTGLKQTNLECESLTYIVNGNTAGVFCVSAIVFKITLA